MSKKAKNTEIEAKKKTNTKHEKKKKKGSKGGKMTSDEKNPTEKNVPMSILVGEKKIFFLI